VFTRVFRETEGEPMIIRKAKAFKRLCETKTIAIRPDELVVGSPGSRPRMAIFCPDICWGWVEEELDTMSSRPQDPYDVAQETKRLIREEILPYWKGRSLYEWFLDKVPEDTRRLAVGTDICDVLIKSFNGPGEMSPGYGNVVFPKGFNAIRDETLEVMKAYDPENPAHKHRLDFLEAVVLVSEGIVHLAKRYAEEAQRQAASETEPRRQAELEGIASVCLHVPGNPPRTFHEAMQMVQFVQMGLAMEVNAPAYSPGRFDQYMYPYFRKDMEDGRITQEEAQELIECLWIKLSEAVWLHSKDDARFFAGYNPFLNLGVGGVTHDGSDATNELSYMCVQASMNVRLFQPSLSVRVHDDTPRDLLVKVFDLVKLGDGFPAIHNDKATIQMMLLKGVSLEDARDCAIVGCVEPNAAGKMAQWSDGGHYNFGSAVEFALFDGYHRLSGEYVGARTGDPRDFNSFNQFKRAVFDQISFFIKHLATAAVICEEAHELFCPMPFGSTTIEDCVKRGLDITMGGARYNAGPAFLGTGVADVSNSLAAVKKFVFDEKRVSMEDLLDALSANFEGYETLRLSLMNEAPKYGNDDNDVDQFALEVTEHSFRECQKYRSRRGCRFISALYPVASHVPHGAVVGALPYGRKMCEPLADGVSPWRGTDLHGPTAALKSVAKIRHANHTAGTLYNMKFNPSVVDGERGTDNLIALVKSFFELGGFHLQFNIISADTLRRAQEHPERYGALMVRVAGYSAYFVHLSREMQDDIIARTEYLEMN
jgi:formate C-acetyltransferase